jgi:hypothetical protein
MTHIDISTNPFFPVTLCGDARNGDTCTSGNIADPTLMREALTRADCPECRQEVEQRYPEFCNWCLRIGEGAFVMMTDAYLCAQHDELRRAYICLSPHLPEHENETLGELIRQAAYSVCEAA